MGALYCSIQQIFYDQYDGNGEEGRPNKETLQPAFECKDLPSFLE